MPEFLKLAPPPDALNTLLQKLPVVELKIENIPTVNSLGRVLGKDICANHPLPEFTRSTVDGYAVQSRDTFGASETQPGYLLLIGEVPMGSAPEFTLEKGTCALIHTGGMLPNGSDAVIMLENTQLIGNTLVKATTKHKSDSTTEIEITKAVANGENILQTGEDVAKGTVVIKTGMNIRPVEIGGCMALGITTINVVAKPRIGLLSCGDEIISPDRITNPGQVRDVNSYSLASLIRESGGEPIHYGIVPDDLKLMKDISARALFECDAIVITAGSSASSRDTTASAIASLGSPGVLFHGINIKPGKPTILAICNGKPVIGLPGNPVSALVIGQLFLVPVIEQLLGVSYRRPRSSVGARLALNIPSQTGREDWVPVKLLENDPRGENPWGTKYIAQPIFGKSNFIFSLAKADGLVCIPADVSGLPVGELVQVILI